MWDLLLELGYQADGLYIGLGIGDYSDAVGQLRPRLRHRPRASTCAASTCATTTATTSRPPPGDPPGAVLGVRAVQAPPVRQGRARRRVRRRRHRAQPRRRGGGAVRQHAAVGGRLPRPPAAGAAGPAGVPEEGQAARPADRAGDRGVVHRPRHRLPGRGVPDGGGQQAPRLQGDAQRRRGRDRPGRRPRSTSTSSSGWRRCSPAGASRRADAWDVRAVRGADDRRRLRVLPPRRGAAAHEPVPVEMLTRRTRRAAHAGARDGPVAVGEKVLLLDTKQRRYLVTLADGGEFHSHTGFVPHARSSAATRASVVASTQGRAVHRAAPDARGLRRRDAARRAGDLPQGPGPDLHARRHRSRACGCSRPASGRARCR